MFILNVTKISNFFSFITLSTKLGIGIKGERKKERGTGSPSFGNKLHK